MNFRLLPPASQELHAAARYYEAAEPGLGFEFLTEVRCAIRRIIAHPQAWLPLDKQIRRCRTHRFPYGVIYTLDGGTIIVISVMHLHRHPDAWRKNLES